MSVDTNNAGSNTHTTTTSSVSAFLSTLVPVAAEAILFVGIFLLMRTKITRVYQPRTYLESLYDNEKSKPLPEGRFNWLSNFRSIPDEFVLNHQSLDGYLYLRFLKMLTIICFVGACITFPILFPVNATGGGGQAQFDLLSFSNIGKNGKNRYYAHVFLGWIFFSFVMWIITRETIYFINLRHAYLTAPFNAARLSSRTVLFTDVPVEYQSREKLQALFGRTMKRCWLSTDCKDLTDKVEERDKDALNLEGAQIKLITKANKLRLKTKKKNEKKAPPTSETDVEAAIPNSEYLNKKDRPTHRLGKIPLIGKQVDIIDFCRIELKRLIPEIRNTQKAHQRNQESQLLPSVFIEFPTQKDAESAFRRMSPRKEPKMRPAAIAATPREIVWGNLRIGKKSRKTRRLLTTTFIVLMIIFWAIPVAVVGAISNINYLTNLVPFLNFINKIPKVILGVVTGLLPSVFLAVLMALVPIICRYMAKLSGEPTLPAIELKTQNWYMAFQVIQVFLVTTFASGAASVVTQIINDPTSATTLLAENLPKASNFYISYFILQGLGIAAGDILNIGALAMLTVVGRFLDKSPRKMFRRYITLSGLGWGSLYPKFGNLGIIAITYSIISPLVLGFATIGFALIYLAVRYNSMYVLTNNVDTRGLAYARALQQLFTGIYLSEVCLIGLFAINTAPGPIVLMAVFTGGTVVYHVMMRNALRPLTRELRGEEAGGREWFDRTDVGGFDAKNAAAPPSEATPSSPSKIQATKGSLFAKLFDPHKFSSHTNVQTLVPAEIRPPVYEEGDLEIAYLDPSVYREVDRLWIVRDEMGISRGEIEGNREVGVETSDDFAFLDEKGKVKWEDEGKERLRDMPVWEKRVDY